MLRVLVLLVAIAAASASITARAPAQPAAHTIEITLVLSSQPAVHPGRFTVSGAIADSGAAAQHALPHAASLAGRVTLAGRRGTISLALFGVRTPADVDWAIVSGTGAYLGLHGAGTIVSRHVVAGATHELLRGTVTR